MEFLPGSIEIENSPGVRDVWAYLEQILRHGEGQCGFRQPSVGVRNKDEIPSFIVIERSLGVVLIDVIDDHVERADETASTWIMAGNRPIESRDIVVERFQSELENRIRQDVSLYDRKTRHIGVPINKVLVFFRNDIPEVNGLRDQAEVLSHCIGRENVLSDLRTFLGSIERKTLDANYLSKVISVLEGTHIFERRKRSARIERLVTKNDFIERSLEHTFKLDETQRKIAMQIPEGPQRIRGLAGTGKTVILCLKAAITHKDFSDFKILFLFNTQSMYGQIRSLISKYFTFEAREEPNWENLDVLHAWGGKAQPGLYSVLCEKYGLKPLTYGDVRRGVGDPLSAIYKNLLDRLADKLEPTYDMVLIDEAQDLPPAVFEVVYRITKAPKRIVWAYDEFQSLTELTIREPEELFGKAASAAPNIPNSALEGQYSGGIDKDFVLPNSYRNPRLVLMVAHGTALGLYRKEGIIDIVTDRKSWRALGYQVSEPKGTNPFTAGERIIVERPDENSRNILENLLRQNDKNEFDLVTPLGFEGTEEQINYVVGSIESLVRDEGVDPAEIIVITLDISNSEKHLSAIRQQLDQKDIHAITPGFVERSSLFKKEGFVTLTTPFRAKGNEGNVIFVLNAQKAVTDPTFRARNALFVAITRARGWCYITGTGQNMQRLIEEISDIKENYPFFEFRFPEEEDIKRRRVILARSDAEIEQEELLLDKLLRKNPELLIEKLKTDPALWRTISKHLKDTNGH